jgi:Spx/MgsR family transcriptional regulator
MYTIYGIANCDSVRKAINFLKEANIPYHFHDYKKSGISKKQLQAWSSQVGFKQLLNPKSSTWRGLQDADKALANGEAGAIELMFSNTSLIKRPLLEQDGRVLLLGFDAKDYVALLN